jgi:single-strand DNA-binding protein
MNKIILIGNITKDCDIRATASGMKTANISLATNDGKDKNGQDQVQYFNCVAFDKQAELFDKYVRKGHKVMVSGKAKNKTWDKPDGSKGYGFEVVVSEVELLTSKVDAERLSGVPVNTVINNTPLPTNEQLSNDINAAAINVTMPF